MNVLWGGPAWRGISKSDNPPVSDGGERRAQNLARSHSEYEEKPLEGLKPE